jgi:hypothetical protein
MRSIKLNLCLVAFGFIAGMGTASLALPVFAQGSPSWTKSQVVPFILVKPGMVDFVPQEVAPLGPTWTLPPTWTAQQVVPVVYVELDSTGYFRVKGQWAPGVLWGQNQVKPMILVKPGPDGFVPAG